MVIEQYDSAEIDKRTHTILLVDDSSINLGLVFENLELQGYEVLVAQDGEEAMQRAQITLPDIILLDVMMPGMDGFEVCRRLKADERTRDIPVIFMTSLGRQEDKIAGFAAGAVDYVTKPLHMEELRARVGAHLQLRDLQRQMKEKNRRLQDEIGQRKRAEEALAGREREFRSLAENLPDNIARWDVTGRILYSNPTHQRTLGKSAGELIGKTHGELFPDGRYAPVDEAVAQIAAGSGAVTFVRAPELREDGETRLHEVKLVPERDADGRVVAVLGIGRDMTDIYRMQEALAAREQEFRTLAENSPDLIGRYDRDCRRLYANHAMAALAGKPAATLVGAPPSDGVILVPELAERLMAGIRNVFASGKSGRVDLTAAYHDGSTHEFDVLLTPEFGSDEEVETVLLLSRDITERKRLETELRLQANFQQSLLNAMSEVGMQLMVVENERITYVANRKLAREFGYDDDELGAGTPLLDIIHPDDRARVMDYHGRRMAGDESVPNSYELGLLTRSGERREYETSAVPVPGSNPLRIITVGKDITERKRMENELRAQADFQRTLLDAINEVGLHLMLIENGKVVHFGNGQRARDFGLSDAEIEAGVSLLEYIHPDDRARIADTHRRRLAGEAVPSSYEYAMLTPGGERREYEAYAAVVPCTQPVRTVVITKDITQRKRQEDELRRREQEFRVLVENSPDVIVRYDRELRRIYINPAWGRANGIAVEAALGKRPSEMAAVVSDTAQEYEAKLREVLESGEPGEIEIGGDDGTGNTKYFSMRVVPEFGKDRKVASVLTVANDITERKLMEARLRESRNFLRTIMDGISDPIFVKDREHRWIEFNEAFRTMVGHPREAMLGKSDYDFLPKEQADVFWEKDEEVFEFGEINVNEEAITGADGVERYIQTKKESFAPEEGGERLLVGVIRDITERRQMELAREAALSEAVRLGQLRSAFLAQMSHELRTPLNGILGYAQNMLLDGSLCEKQRVSLSIIRNSGDHLLDLLNDVLDHAKIEADKLSLNIENVQLEVLLCAVIELTQARAEQKKLEFSCRVDAGLPAVIRGDGQRLRQVLLNLLSNAVKFTDRGQVSLHLSRPAPGRIRFEVRDSGIGIAADKLEVIFLPFEQAGDAHLGGTGLGLAISRKLVRLMGGNLKVESCLGEGSAFYFELEAEGVQSETLDAGIIQKISVRPAPSKTPVLVPPRQELESLYELAKRGNMRNIAQRAAALVERDECYAPFTGQLMELAKGYQSKAILQFIEQFLAGDPSSAK